MLPADIAKLVAIVAALVIGVVLTYGVLRLVGEQHKQSCIAEAQARYPALVVGPANGAGLGYGGQHVTNKAALQTALDDCTATIF